MNVPSLQPPAIDCTIKKQFMFVRLEINFYFRNIFWAFGSFIWSVVYEYELFNINN